MRDYIWPRCPSNWNGEERQFFRALIELLQRMGQPITEKDLSKKLLDKINNGVKPEEPKPETPETPEETIQNYLFNEGLVDGITWSGNVLKRRENQPLGFFDLSQNGFMQVYIGTSTSTYAVPYNAHVITDSPVTIPENATKLNVEANFGISEITMNFGLLPSTAPYSDDVSAGGQMTGYMAVSENRTVYSMELNDSVKGKDNLHAVINGEGTSGKDTQRRNLNIYRVWFE